MGAPCGVMDQLAVALGRAGRLLALLCQPAEMQPDVQIPDSVRFWGIDSGAPAYHTAQQGMLPALSVCGRS